MQAESTTPAGREWPLLLTIPDTAFQLSCSERSVYDYVGQGLLELVKINKRSRITSESVRRLAAQRTKTAASRNLKQFKESAE